jgi:hypothetical protein
VEAFVHHRWQLVGVIGGEASPAELLHLAALAQGLNVMQSVLRRRHPSGAALSAKVL